MKRTYKDYLQDVLSSLREIEDFTKDMDFETFMKDKKNRECCHKKFRGDGRSR